jgi:hypothetical protein
VLFRSVRIENGVIQWRTGDGEWQDFMTLEALKAQYPEYFGATPTPEPEQTSEPTATPAATSSSAPTKSSSGSKATATPKPTAKVTATPKITATPLPQSSDSSGGGSSGGGSSSGDREDIGWSDDQLLLVYRKRPRCIAAFSFAHNILSGRKKVDLNLRCADVKKII